MTDNTQPSHEELARATEAQIEAASSTAVAKSLLESASIEELAAQLNAHLDLPWVPESVEQRWIEWLLAKILPVVPEKIAAVLISAADGLSLEELAIAEEHITRLVNKLVDIPLIPEGVEEGLIRPVVRQLLTFALQGKSLTLAK